MICTYIALTLSAFMDSSISSIRNENFHFSVRLPLRKAETKG